MRSSTESDTPAATRRGAGKFVVAYDDGETEEVTLPEEGVPLCL